MRPWAFLLLALLLPPALPSGTATDTGDRPYLVAFGPWVRDFDCYNGAGCGFGWTNCGETEEYLWPLLGEDVGCRGGTIVYTSEAWALFSPGVTWAQIQAQGVTLYLRHVLTVVDDLSGPNVYASACNYHPQRNTDDGANVCDDGAFDGVADAVANGCGFGLVADATDVHAGNFWTNAFVYALYLDASSSQVCVGTSGSTSVVYS